MTDQTDADDRPETDRAGEPMRQGPRRSGGPGEGDDLTPDPPVDPALGLDPSLDVPAPHSLAADGGLPPQPAEVPPPPELGVPRAFSDDGACDGAASDTEASDAAASGQASDAPVPGEDLASQGAVGPHVAPRATSGAAAAVSVSPATDGSRTIPTSGAPGAPATSGNTSMTIHRMVAHDRLAHQSRIVLRLGQMLLSCGASAFRVKHAMAKLARAVGIEQHHAQVTYTEIIATAYASGTFRTELAEQRAMGVNADKIDLLSNYVDSLEGRQVLVEDVDEALDRIERVPALYGWLANALASGVACAGFSFLNHGGWVECSVVAVAAFFGQFLRRQMLHRRMNHFGAWMASGAVAATIYILLVAAAQQWLGLEPTHQAGFISALLFLVPGFPLVTGIIDLVRQDFQAGIARLVYVCMLVVSAGVAVWSVSLIFNWSVTPVYDYHLTAFGLYSLRLGTSFVASYGFAMLFNSPPKVCAAAAAIGALINVGRLFLVDQVHVPVQAAVGIAALAAGLLATLVARSTKFSRVTLSVPAVVIMIPGVPLYRSLAYLNDGQTNDALAALFTVFFTIISIGVGLAVSRMVTDRNWLMETPRGVPSLGRDLTE